MCLNTSPQRSTPGPFAVPHGEYAVVIRVADQVDLLRAPDGGRGQLFVDAGLELDVVRVEMLARLPERLVQPAERRAAIAGDEAGGIQAGGLVAPALHQRQAHQRLDAGQIDAAGVGNVLVVQRDCLHV